MQDKRDEPIAKGAIQSIVWEKVEKRPCKPNRSVQRRRFQSLRRGQTPSLRRGQTPSFLWGQTPSFLKARQLKGLVRYRKTYQKKRVYLEGIYLLNHYGEVLFNQGDNESALTAFLDAVELAPNHAICHNNVGVTYWKKGELNKAVYHFAKAREIDPDDRNTVWNCGQIMASVGEYLTARYIYTDYMKHNGYDQEMAREIASL